LFTQRRGRLVARKHCGAQALAADRIPVRAGHRNRSALKLVTGLQLFLRLDPLSQHAEQLEVEGAKLGRVRLGLHRTLKFAELLVERAVEGEGCGVQNGSFSEWRPGQNWDQHGWIHRAGADLRSVETVCALIERSMARKRARLALGTKQIQLPAVVELVGFDCWRAGPVVRNRDTVHAWQAKVRNIDLLVPLGNRLTRLRGEQGAGRGQHQV
jgi:hypothetical protein